ncbi:MAG: electron transfer flavoprotein beta subunit/FixA family protein [Flavobacteriales bacterium]
MNILVCISKAPETTTKVSFKENNTKFNEEGVQYIVNPADEWYALVRGLELKEQHGGKVTTITVGKEDDEPIIRKALAIGADDAIRINAEPLDGFYVAKQIEEHAKEGGYDMILCGNETINYNGGQVPGMIAELMDIPYVANANDLQMEGETATIEHKIQGGSEVLEVKPPFILGATKGMAEQRIPNMRGIMAARQKQLNVVEPIDIEMHTSVRDYELPPPKSECKFVDAENPEKLLDLLKNEAKVL